MLIVGGLCVCVACPPLGGGPYIYLPSPKPPPYRPSSESPHCMHHTTLIPLCPNRVPPSPKPCLQFLSSHYGARASTPTTRSRRTRSPRTRSPRVHGGHQPRTVRAARAPPAAGRPCRPGRRAAHARAQDVAAQGRAAAVGARVDLALGERRAGVMSGGARPRDIA